MERMTTESPNSNTENMFNQVFVKDREVYLRYMGENGEPINLSDYVRKFMPDMREYDNETLMDVMCDDWGDDFVPLIYSLAVGFAEVRGRLSKYEDTELMPDKVAALKAENERLRDEQGVAGLCLNKLIALCCEAEISEACGMCKSNGEDCHGDAPEWSGLE